MTPLLLLLAACRPTPDPGPSTPLPPEPAPAHTGSTTPEETAHTGVVGPTGTSTTGHTGLALEATWSTGSHQVSVTVDAPRSGGQLACTSPDEPLEDFLLDLPADPWTEAVLHGLLGDTTYDCTLTLDGELARRSVRTPVDVVDTRWSIDDHDPGRALRGYTLFNHGRSDSDIEPHELIVVDPEGRVRWEKLLPGEYPDCDVSILLPDQTVLYGGGQGITPTIETLGGDVLWQAPVRAFEERYHHHAERLPDGDVLTMTHTLDTDGVDTWTGFRIERLGPKGELTWSWTSQRGFDDGVLPLPALGANDPWHANSVQVGDDGTTYVNLRQKHWILAIAPDGTVAWKLGAGGDFALVDATGAPLPDTDWFYGAHAPEHHGDRILFHDNGWSRPGFPLWARALELVIDVDAKTATPTWDWREDGWYEPIWGDIDELPDGTVLTTRGHCGGCDPEDTSQLVEIHRASGDVVWRLVFTDTTDSTYRSQRVGGCELFANRRYCAP